MIGSVCFLILLYNVGIYYFVTVKIYVKLHHNSPILVCMDFKRSIKETVDPTYLWIGPNKRPLTGKLYDFNILFFNDMNFF